MTSREAILRAVGPSPPGAREHPGRFRPAPADASWSSFAARLAEAGGESFGPVPQSELSAAVRSVAERFGGERRVAEPAALALIGDESWSSAADAGAPSDLASVDVGAAVGVLGVAENGAVALVGDAAPHRPLLVLAERLILLLDADRIVADMHAAIDALGEAASRHHHTTWIAGPSKTADIEQALVVGAHGPRALCVVGYTGPDDFVREPRPLD